MWFFTPAYLKEAEAVLHNTSKLLSYRRDLLKPAVVDEINGQMDALRLAIQTKNREAVENLFPIFEIIFQKHLPPPAHPDIRENCEVFLVSIVIALAVRTFFLQPFTIPTGSMQPTLNGIIGVSTSEAPPNPAKQLLDFCISGRTYLDTAADSDCEVVSMKEVTRFSIFTVTEVKFQTASGQVFTKSFWAPIATMVNGFNIRIGTVFRSGESIARGYVTTGDHVFVDKCSYNFHAPSRGDVFVFKTSGILYIENDLREKGIEGSQFYIKRLAGLPGDELRIDAPRLYINGAPASEPGFRKVMSGSLFAPVDGYRGYTNPERGASYLTTPDSRFHVPSNFYFALGDNSANSSDSRYWGIVPEQNIAGRGLFVYWPFGPHWGWIH